MEVENEDTIVWSAFHASMQNPSDLHTTLTQLLPLFYDKAASAAVIKHGMNVVGRAADYLNPGQIHQSWPLMRHSKLLPNSFSETGLMCMGKISLLSCLEACTSR